MKQMMQEKYSIIVLLVLCLLALTTVSCGSKTAQVVTLAGSESGYTDGVGTAAKFSSPMAVAVDKDGNVYVADYANSCIRKITPDGTVTTLAGTDQPDHADGSVVETAQSKPTGLALATSGALYVADCVLLEPDPTYVRIITPDGKVTTLAGSSQPGYKDGPGLNAQFRSPASVVVDQAGNVYVADTTNHRIRRISPTGEVTTFASSPKTGYVIGYADGPAAEAKFQGPHGMAVDKTGNVYVADTGNHCLRVISPDGHVSTLAGTNKPGYADGKGNEARFNFPSDVAVDAQGNLYVTDTANHRIRKVTPAGVVTTLAGTGLPGNADGPADRAQFQAPEGIAVDAQGNVIVVSNHRIRKIIQP
jgi:sugar lactone lactonase YvrE